MKPRKKHTHDMTEHTNTGERTTCRAHNDMSNLQTTTTATNKQATNSRNTWKKNKRKFIYIQLTTMRTHGMQSVSENKNNEHTAQSTTKRKKRNKRIKLMLWWCTSHHIIHVHCTHDAHIGRRPSHNAPSIPNACMERKISRRKKRTP